MKFIKENGPHIKNSDTTSKIMTRLLIALIPIISFAIDNPSPVPPSCLVLALSTL